MQYLLHLEGNPAGLTRVAELIREPFGLRQMPSTREASQIAPSDAPAVVLVGRDTGHLDPFETVLRLRSMEAFAKVPIVTLAKEAERRAFMALGADGVVDFPVTGEALVETLQHFVQTRRTRPPSGDRALRELSHRMVENLEKNLLELSAANERLEELAELRRELLRNLTHELATPMTPILGYLGLLLGGDLGDLTPLQRKGLGSIKRSVIRLKDLIDTLLDMSALERGSLHFFHRDYDFADVVFEAVQRAREVSTEAVIRTKFLGECILGDDSDVPMMTAEGDPEKLRRAVAHILRNAVKFSPRGTPVDVSAKDEGEYYSVSVKDRGPGIHDDEISRVLEPFYQKDGSATRAHDGVGIGLSFALHVCHGLGGGLGISTWKEGGESGTIVTLRVRVSGQRASDVEPIESLNVTLGRAVSR